MLQRLSGPSGEVMAGPIRAATLGPWALVKIEDAPPGTFAFTASTSVVDSYWITRPAHDLRLRFGNEAIVYRGVSLTVSGGRATGVVHAEQRSRSDESRRSQQHETGTLAGSVDRSP